MPSTRSFLAASVLAAVTLLSGVVAAPAFAHTSLIGAEPADESTVATLPDEISLAFSGEVQEPAFVVVTDPDGTELQRGDAVVDGMYVRQKVDASDAVGTHTITYRVVSADGHPVQGAITATVDPQWSEDSEDSEPAATPTPAHASGDTGGDGDGDWPPYLLIAAGLLAVLGALLARSAVKRRSR